MFSSKVEPFGWSSNGFVALLFSVKVSTLASLFSPVSSPGNSGVINLDLLSIEDAYESDSSELAC